MKIQEFVKKEPHRAGFLMLILAIAFAACFSALIALGGCTIYARAQFSDTNTELLAADLLSLKDALCGNNEADAQIYKALLRSRMMFVFSKNEAKKLDDLLVNPDARFYQLCAEIEELLTEDSLSSARLMHAVNNLINTESAYAPGEESPASSLQTTRHVSDPVAAAETYFGIRGLFSSASTGAYCKNLYADFGAQNGGMTVYTCACAPGAVRLTESECVMRALNFASAQQITDCRLISAAERYGIWWVELADKKDTIIKVGVRGDIGQVCFFLRNADL